MVLFCELCGTVLVPEYSRYNGHKNQNITLSCSKCGKVRKTGFLNGHYTVNITLGSASAKQTIIIDSNGAGGYLPVESIECPRCSNSIAYYSEFQDNRLEEYERALVYCCTKCKHVFRQ